MKNLSILDKLLYVLNSFLATILLLSYALPFISPETIPAFAILSLLVPILIVVNIIFVIYWLVKLKKQFIVSAAVLGIGFLIVTPFYKLSKKTTPLNSDIKLMSYNVKSFDLFHQTKKETTATGYDFITEINPDVLLIQEYYQSTKVKLNFPYQFIELKSKGSKFGMAIYSKYKIINSGSLNLKNTSNNIIFADIVKEKDTIRVYNLHLESLRIKPNEENFGEKSSEKLIERVSKSFQKQTSQTAILLLHEKKWKGKKIIAGDFNNTAYSWVYKQICQDKKDAFIQAGKGFGKTYSYFLPTRIDFILTDQKASINTFYTYDVKYSDHYPILSRISW